MQPNHALTCAVAAHHARAAIRAGLVGLCLVFALLFSVAGAAPVHAKSSQPLCYAPVSDIAETRAHGGAALSWTCSSDTPSIAPANIAVRLPVTAATGTIEEAAAPRFFITRHGRFDSLTLLASDKGGVVRSVSYRPEELKPSYMNGQFLAPLPQVTADTQSVIAIFERPRAGVMLQQGALISQPPVEEDGSTEVLLLLALVTGFLLAPVLFDIVFYRALRETFALWHALMALALAAHLASSGVILFAFPMNLPQITAFSTITFTGLLMAAFMFSRAMIEPGKLHPVFRNGLLVCAILSALLLTARYLPLESTRPWIFSFYFAVHGPMLLFLVAAAVDAWRRGSRAIRFLALAWAPFVALGIIRVVTHVTPIAAPDDAVWLFRFAAVFEIAVTSIAVTDRFVSLRRQRDSALKEASRMVDMAEHDQLTGLHNRRALENRFDDLRFKGFDTFAVLDLDRFKDINDSYGHAVGDEVLAAVGRTLADDTDRDMRAFRLGGEEFVLMLRGTRTLERAEAMRQAIPLQVAKAVSGIDRLVTASMGAVEAPRDGRAAMTLRSLYTRADTLLYEAKSTGRNRLVAERMTIFDPRGLAKGASSGDADAQVEAA